MKIQTQTLCGALLAVAFAPALAQNAASPAELTQAATGPAFTVGSTEFRLAPSAVVRPADAGAAGAGIGLPTAGYTVDLPANAKAARAQAQSTTLPGGLAAAAPAGGGENLAVAVSASGGTVIVKPELDVYITHIGVVDALVKDSGGTLLYSSDIGGKATIGFGSVDQAMAARERILGRAGVKDVAPVLLEQRQVAW